MPLDRTDCNSTQVRILMAYLHFRIAQVLIDLPKATSDTTSQSITKKGIRYEER